MKRNLFLLMAFFALTCCLNAQTVLLNEGFEGTTLPTGWTTIDADGDGFNWEIIDVEDNYDVHAGNHCITSASYDNATHSILHPNNWLITPAITLSHAASLSFYVVSQQFLYPEHYGVYVSTTGTDTSNFTLLYENESPDEYEEVIIDLAAYTGTIYVAFRHFNSSDNFMLNIDDIKITEYSTPYLTTDLSTLDFGQINVGENDTLSLSLTAYNLTQPITATVTAPFSVSTDNVTFNTTTSMPATGGTLYVKYAPTTAATDNTTLTLSSAGVDNITITLQGLAVDCSNDIVLPYEQGFENGMPLCYTLLDADGDGANWEVYDNMYPHSGTYNALSEIADETTDNWLIMSPFTVGTNPTELSFYVDGFGSMDNYGVYISTTGTDTADFTSVLQGTTTIADDILYELKTVDLSSYAGQTIYIAFRHYNPTGLSFALLLDDIAIHETTGDNTLYVDYALQGFKGDGNELVEEIFVQPGQGIKPKVMLTNNGPEVPATTDTVYFEASINGNPTGKFFTMMGSNLAMLTTGLSTFMGGWVEMFSAAELDEMGLTGSFEFSYTVRIGGEAVDTVASNNTASVTITRLTEGDAPEVDYALDGFADENGNIIHELTIEANQGISPAVVITNNGPDVPAATDTVFFDISFNGAPAEDAIYILGADIAPLTAGQQSSLGMQGDLYTAANLDALGLTGTFTCSFTVRIVGQAIDPNDANNTTTLTITRNSNDGIEAMSNNAPVIYPNPATNHINIDNAENATITLLDLSGKAILSEKATSDNYMLNVSNVSQGLYLLRIENNNNVTTQKISIVK